MSKRIVIANWKMKLSLAESLELAKKYKQKFAKFKKEELAVCPSYLVIREISKIMKGVSIKVGAQDVFWEEKGAYTGEVSPSMLKEAGCSYAIIGHSERRKYLLENYQMIHQELKAVLNIKDLTPIVCIGEEAEERKTDKRDFVLVDQLQQALGGIQVFDKQQIIIAYEPIWAIGSGITIEPEEAEYAHKIIKLALNEMFGMRKVSEHFRVIYGGSISGDNVKDFANLDGVDGLLVGGASLDEKEFYKIAKTML